MGGEYGGVGHLRGEYEDMVVCREVSFEPHDGPEIQMRRLMERDAHLTREDAENRVRSQTDVREKARRCEERGAGNGVVLWNDGSREELKGSLDVAMADLHRQNPVWWSWLLLGMPPLALLLAAWRFWRMVFLCQVS